MTCSRLSEIEGGRIDVKRDCIVLGQLFTELETEYQPLAQEKQITLMFDLSDDSQEIQGNRGKILLALHNLLNNALDYTPSGGRVTVSETVDRGNLIIDVADTGIGIREDEHEKIFEKFSRSQDPRLSDISGNGLGLALAREVIRLHGGDITVQSQIDKGSTFTLRLPAIARAE